MHILEVSDDRLQFLLQIPHLPEVGALENRDQCRFQSTPAHPVSSGLFLLPFTSCWSFHPKYLPCWLPAPAPDVKLTVSPDCVTRYHSCRRSSPVINPFSGGCASLIKFWQIQGCRTQKSEWSLAWACPCSIRMMWKSVESSYRRFTMEGLGLEPGLWKSQSQHCLVDNTSQHWDVYTMNQWLI